MTDQLPFDVFLAHSSADKPQVKAINDKLKQRGFNPWLDDDLMCGGDSPLAEIQNGLKQSKCVAFFLGSGGSGKWQGNAELPMIAQLAINSGLRLIPVLLPGVEKMPDDPQYLFLQTKIWISFKSIDDDDSLNRLEKSIQKAASQINNQPVSPPPVEDKLVEVESPSQVLEFNVVTVNSKGQEIKRKKAQAQYRTEQLGKDVTLEMVSIPEGSFEMGMPAEERKIALENMLKYNFKREDAEKWLDRSIPQHQVELPAFWMGKYAVTNAQWQAVMGTKPSEKYDRKFQGDKQPVVGISWHEARAFCKKLKLSANMGREVRLPTEAEWEYACRAGTTTPFHFCETISTNLVNYNGNYPYADAPKGEYRERTVDVDGFSPNAWGLHQMHGNVWEWCLDEFHDNYSTKPDRLKIHGNEAWGDLNLNEDDNHNRSFLLRGGSWYNDAQSCRSAYRYLNAVRYQDNPVGFRVVCGLR